MNKTKIIIYLLLLYLASCFSTNAVIKDALFVTVGSKAVTKSDIVNEIKIILILNNESYSEEKRDKLQQMAIKSIVKRNIKQIAIDKNNFLEFNQQDLEKELNRLANSINIDLDTLKNICASNELDFSIVENQIIVELLWNSLIFQLYKDRLSINIEEINEQLKLIQNKKKLQEFLISEIVIKPVEKDNLEKEIKRVLESIKIDGFEKFARNESISSTAIKGGDLGWVHESIISKQFKSKIINTPIGHVSEPIVLSKGILFFKVRDKRNIKKNLTLEQQKNLIVNAEKTKILNMYSLSHYDNLRRTVAVKFY